MATASIEGIKCLECGVCPRCHGLKIVEMEHGMISMRCPDCNGLGVIDANSGIDEGTGQPDTDDRGPTPGEPGEPKESEARKEPRKRSKKVLPKD